MCVGFCSVEVAPSPKSQSQLSIVSFPETVEVSSKLTVRGPQPN